MLREIAIHLKVTTKNAQLLLRPSETLNSLIIESIAQYQNKRKIKIFALTVLSNQLHLLYKKPTSTSYAFQNALLGSIEKKVNHLLNRSDSLWAETFTEYPVLTQTALIDSISHVACKPVEKGLVPFPHIWPGLCLYSNDKSTNKQLKCSRAALLRSLTESEYTQTIEKIVEQRATSISVKHVKNKHVFHVAEEILKQSPFSYSRNYRKKTEGISNEQILEALPQQLSHEVRTRTR